MLIKCSECNTSVSDKAPSCPKCGCPISSTKKAEVHAIGESPTTTQATSKRLKALHAVFVVIFMLGIIATIVTTTGKPQSEPSVVPVLLLVIGFVGYIITRVRIWWHHG